MWEMVWVESRIDRLSLSVVGQIIWNDNITDELLVFGCFGPGEQVIMEMTDGGADYCFECVGAASLVHEAFACCRKVCVLLSLSL